MALAVNKPDLISSENHPGDDHAVTGVICVLLTPHNRYGSRQQLPEQP